MWETLSSSDLQTKKEKQNKYYNKNEPIKLPLYVDYK